MPGGEAGWGESGLMTRRLPLTTNTVTQLLPAAAGEELPQDTMVAQARGGRGQPRRPPQSGGTRPGEWHQGLIRNTRDRWKYLAGVKGFWG